MSETRMRVVCPQCGAAYRVDADAVPAEGATAACKKCGRKFRIRKPAPDSGVAMPEPKPAGSEFDRERSSSAGIFGDDWETDQEPKNSGPQSLTTKSSAESSFTCPACGRQQTQPYTCYACGAVITPREPSPTTPVPAPAAGAASRFDIGMAEIVVRTRFNPSDWILNFAQPRVSIDGMEFHHGWGAHALRIPEGDCQVVVDYKFFMGRRGRAVIPVRATAGEKVYIDYTPQGSSGSAPGTVRKSATAEGLLWRIEAGSGRSGGMGLYSRKAVIISLIVLGPLALFQLWKSEAFSIRAKIAVTVFELALMGWFFSRYVIPPAPTPVP